MSSELHRDSSWAIPEVTLTHSEEHGGLPGGGCVTKTWASKGSFGTKCCISVPRSSYCPCPAGRPRAESAPPFRLHSLRSHPAPCFQYGLFLMIPNFYLLTRVLTLTAHLTSPCRGLNGQLQPLSWAPCLILHGHCPNPWGSSLAPLQLSCPIRGPSASPDGSYF